MQIRRVLVISAAAVLLASVLPALAQRNNNNNAPKRSQGEQADIETLVRLVDASMTSDPILVTAAGAALQHGCRDLFAAFGRIEDSLAGLRGLEGGRLRRLSTASKRTI